MQSKTNKKKKNTNLFPGFLLQILCSNFLYKKLIRNVILLRQNNKIPTIFKHFLFVFLFFLTQVHFCYVTNSSSSSFSFLQTRRIFSLPPFNTNHNNFHGLFSFLFFCYFFLLFISITKFICLFMIFKVIFQVQGFVLTKTKIKKKKKIKGKN